MIEKTSGFTGCGKTPEEKKTVPSAAEAALLLMHLRTA
jgi:hypothetical protein